MKYCFHSNLPFKIENSRKLAVEGYSKRGIALQKGINCDCIDIHVFSAILLCKMPLEIVFSAIYIGAAHYDH